MFKQRSRPGAGIWSVLLAPVLTLALIAGPRARAAQPLTDSTLQAVHIQGTGHLQTGDSRKEASSGKSAAPGTDDKTQQGTPQNSQEPSDAAVAAFLQIPPKTPPNIADTVANRQIRLFEENPEGLRPPARLTPQVPTEPSILELFRPGPVGDTTIRMTPAAAYSAQSQREGNSLLIRTNSHIDDVTVHNARDVSGHIRGDYSVRNLEVKGTIRVTPNP